MFSLLKTGKMEQFMTDLDVITWILICCLLIKKRRIGCVDPESAGGVSGARSGSPRYQQRLPVQSHVASGRALLNIDDGAPPFRPVRHDPQRGFQQHPPGRLDAAAGEFFQKKLQV